MTTQMVMVNSVSWKGSQIYGATQARATESADMVRNLVDGYDYEKRPALTRQRRQIDIDFLFGDTLDSLAAGDKGVLIVVTKEGKGGSNATRTYTNAVLAKKTFSTDPSSGIAGTVTFRAYATGTADPLVIT